MIKSKLHSFIDYLHPSSDYVFPQSHTVYELVFYLTGSGSTTVNKEKYNYQQGDFILIKPNDLHDERTYDPTNVRCVLFEIEGIEIESIFVKNNPEISKEIEKLLDIIAREFQSKNYQYEEYINNILNQIMIVLMRFIGKKDDEYTNYDYKSKLIDYTKSLIKEKYHIAPNLDIIATNLGYSYDRLRHIFKEVTGVSLKHYQLEVRLFKAKELLLSTKLPIADIASASGFKSSIRFSTFFRERMGVSPQKYRKLVSENLDRSLLNLDIGKEI